MVFLYQKVNSPKLKCIIYGKHTQQNDAKNLWIKGGRAKIHQENEK